MERKVALITGGAKGIGRQIALSLAENGHDIAVNYHSDKNSADEICKTAKENGVNALSFYANMGNVDEIKNMEPDATILDGLHIGSSSVTDAESRVSEWVQGLGLSK